MPLSSLQRPCLIFNPSAQGDKARRLSRHLEHWRSACTVKETWQAGSARWLAAGAVREGYNPIVAAGGDGTLNEVINGIGDEPDGFERTRLGILPLGTMNVFAREWRIPLNPNRAWQTLSTGRTQPLDLPRAEWSQANAPNTQYFAQLAGVGWDARAVELVCWQWKKRLGALAYVLAAFKVLRERPPQLRLSHSGGDVSGSFALIGNGRFYGGPYPLFERADPTDGRVDVYMFRTMGFFSLLRFVPAFLRRRASTWKGLSALQLERFRIESEPTIPFELDGELVGHSPVEFSVSHRRLHIIVPSAL